jgi:hypothetical protein
VRVEFLDLGPGRPGPSPPPGPHDPPRPAARDFPRLAPDTEGLPLAPRGGPFDVRIGGPGGALARTAVVDLDPARDVTPVRPAAVAPAPAPAAPEDPSARWRALLLAAAGLLLLLDLGLAALSSRRLARATRSA